MRPRRRAADRHLLGRRPSSCTANGFASRNDGTHHETFFEHRTPSIILGCRSLQAVVCWLPGLIPPFGGSTPLGDRSNLVHRDPAARLRARLELPGHPPARARLRRCAEGLINRQSGRTSPRSRAVVGRVGFLDGVSSARSDRSAGEPALSRSNDVRRVGQPRSR
jgi:hypothetical protein